MKSKIITSIILTFTILMSVFTGNVLAASLGSHGTGLNKVKDNGASAVGNTVTARYSDMTARTDLYCVMHGKALSGNVVFSINKYIRIDGNTATDESGRTVNSIENGKLAYILHRGEGYGSDAGYTTTQKGVYGTINNWYDAVGSRLGVNSAIKYSGNNTYKNQSIIAEAENYAKSISDESESGEVKDNTNKSNIRVTAYSKDDTGYVRVGPFNWSFAGKIVSATVYGDNDKKISDVKFSTFKGTEEIFYSSASEITTGKNFYITLKVNSGFTKIGKIVAKHKLTDSQTIYTAELWFLKHTSKQNLMLVNIGSYNKNPEPVETPFDYNIQLTKNIELEKVDSVKTDKKLSNVKFILKNKETGKYVKQSGSGYTFVDNKSDATEFKTGDNGKVTIENIPIAVYYAYETENPNKGYEIKEEATTIESAEINKQITNKYHLGEFGLEKVDKDHTEIKLKEVEFTLVGKSGKYAGKYVGLDNDGNAIYSDSEVRIKTDSNGKLNVKELWEGTYTLTEVNNPNYGYIIDPDSQNIEIEVTPYNTTSKQIKNEQYYIRLSGFIWQDMNAENKSTTRNDYYKTNGIPSDYIDDQDIENCNGITVRLKRISDDSIVYEGKPREREFTNKEQITTSGEKGIYGEIEGGEYIFEYVRVKELSDYYVEFEYDGVIYKSVVANINHNYGSKADDKVDRATLDANFASVNATGENKVNVNNQYIIDYNGTNNHEASIKYNNITNSTIKNLSYSSTNKGLVNAKTKDAKCDISKYFVPGNPDIKYINLGLYEKPQADMSLGHDLDNVNVGVNGYWHVYKYGSRHIEQKTSDSWNVGVKFNKNDKYTRAVYAADITYEDPTDKSQNLQVYLTYKIALTNESTYWTRVNSIVDYFDSNYEISAVGTGISTDNIGKLTITGNLNYGEVSNYNNNYKKVIINTNSMVKSAESNYVYIQFRLDKTAVLKIMNNQETLYNRAEINSYTACYDQNGNSMAVIDSDSVIGNIDKDITNIDYYEDDTEAAPPVQLELANARTIQGNVFLDSTTGELRVNETRNGNGIYDNGETPISGVKVTLHELNNSIEDKIVEETDGNGYYEFSEFVPGQYTITYTWGDKTYTVQNYKGTIYNNSERQNRTSAYNNPWYKDGYPTFEPRYSDAMDDYNLRKQIDEQIASITDNTVNDKILEAYDEGYTGDIINKMNSTTPTMEFSVEYETTETDGTDDKVEFIIKNIDFGIAERARQKLDMVKRVKAFKITLANGQILVDATVEEKADGTRKVEGTKNNLTYMGPSIDNGLNSRGYIKAEMDSEIMEGAVLEVTYEIKVINNSEVDYISENYYKYGTIEGPKVTIIPSVVVDYLDRNLGYEPEKNSAWQYTTEEELRTLNISRIENAEYMNTKNVLKTEAMRQALEPSQKVSVDLYVSKLLSTSQDMTFKNDSETAKIEKQQPGGSPVITTKDTDSDGREFTYITFSSSEDSIIVPSTGDNKGFIVPTIIAITSLAVLGLGTFGIKKFIIDKK